MARTHRNEIPKWYRHENGEARKATRKAHRTAVKQAIRNGNVDALPLKKGTEGWVSH